MSEPKTEAGRAMAGTLADLTGYLPEEFTLRVCAIEAEAIAAERERIAAAVNEGPWVYVDHWEPGDPDIPAITVSAVRAIVEEIGV
jgi:hypothetical protein